MDLKNKKIMVTGGAGFVGSFLLEELLKEDVSEIVVLDNFFRGSKANIEFLLDDSRLKLIEGDIRDRQCLDALMEPMDLCFHLAALRITHCAAEPRQALEVMYDGMFNVLEACVKHNIEKLVTASSASIYGQADSFPTQENHHPYNNQTLYGAAKMANELMCRSFFHMYGLPFNALRYFNIYGPRMDTHGKYTEVLIRWYYLIKEGKPPLIYGGGKQTMDFIFVKDIARATLLSMQADCCNQAFNVASQVETSLEELCFMLCEVMKTDLKPKYIPLPEDRKKVEVGRRLADTQKAKELIGFESQVDLKQGLSQLVGWLDSLTPEAIAARQ